MAQARRNLSLHRAALDLLDPTESRLVQLFCGDWIASDNATRASGDDSGRTSHSS